MKARQRARAGRRAAMNATVCFCRAAFAKICRLSTANKRSAARTNESNKLKTATPRAHTDPSQSNSKSRQQNSLPTTLTIQKPIQNSNQIQIKIQKCRVRDARHGGVRRPPGRRVCGREAGLCRGQAPVVRRHRLLRPLGAEGGGGVACAVCACVLCMCVCVLFVRLLCVSRASFQTIINFCLCCAFVAPSAWRRAFPPS